MSWSFATRTARTPKTTITMALHTASRRPEARDCLAAVSLGLGSGRAARSRPTAPRARAGADGRGRGRVRAPALGLGVVVAKVPLRRLPGLLERQLRLIARGALRRGLRRLDVFEPAIVGHSELFG